MAEFTDVKVSDNTTDLIQKAEADFFGGKRQIVVSLGTSGKATGELKTEKYNVVSAQRNFGSVSCTSVEGVNGPWYFSIG